MPFDFYIGANYMYLARPPLINNRLIIGDWSFYLIVLEFLSFVLMYFTYRLFLLSKSKRIA